MTEKRKKSEQLAKVWQRLKEIDAAEQKQRQACGDFVNSIQGLQPLEKAEAWLSYVADDIEYWGDQEALVYLKSRGRDCSAQINKLVSVWKTAAQRSIEQCAEGGSVINVETGETKKVGGMSIAEASDVKNLSPFLLRNFWGGHDSQELTIDATMLRTVEWCVIGGFDEWWERLAQTVNEDLIRGGIDPLPGGWWLFSMCRSDYAIQLMEHALNRSLEAIEIPNHKQTFPWRVLRERETHRGRDFQLVDHLPCAATIVFASVRLRRDEWHSDLVHQALETLQKHQDDNGAWRCWAEDGQPSVEATAMALHALTIGRPRG